MKKLLTDLSSWEKEHERLFMSIREGLTDEETPEEVIGVALDFEKDSILFFLGMKEMVPARLGPDKVDRLVREEMNHVAYLKRQLAKRGK